MILPRKELLLLVGKLLPQPRHEDLLRRKAYTLSPESFEPPVADSASAPRSRQTEKLRPLRPAGRKDDQQSSDMRISRTCVRKCD